LAASTHDFDFESQLFKFSSNFLGWNNSLKPDFFRKSHKHLTHLELAIEAAFEWWQKKSFEMVS
jgi:hypothetical protein